MMAIVHLSDLHIESLGKPSSSAAEKVASAVIANIESAGVCFIVVSGDIANTGTEQEYESAFNFLATLSKEISSSREDVQVHYILVPGNHDCDLNGGSSGVRRAAIAALQNEERWVDADASVINACVGVQDAFFDFAACLRTAYDDTPANRLFIRAEFDIEGVRVAFDCYNTAWMSVLKERKGSLYFPLQAIPAEYANADLTVAVLHHPTSWLVEASEKQLSRRLEDYSQVVLTGHEHDPDEGTTSRLTGAITEYVEGGVLDITRGNLDGGFNILLFKTAPRQAPMQKIQVLEWSSKDRAFITAKTRDWDHLSASSHAVQYRFRISKGFSRLLQDPGILSYLVTERKCPNLDRFAVLADLRRESRGGGSVVPSNVRIPEDQVVSTLLKMQKCWISGETLSGKTTFLRLLFCRLHDLGHYPLLLDGTKMTSRIAVTKEIKRAIAEQYEDATFESYTQQHENSRVVLIDDIQKSRHKLLAQTIEELDHHFDVMVFMSDDIGTASGLFTGGPLNLDSFTYYRVGKLGRHARSKLLRGWLEATLPASTPDSKVTEHLVVLEANVNSLVKRLRVPSYPIFILTAAHQTGLPQTSALSLGSIGQLFYALMTLTLAQLDVEQFSNLNVYLAALAFHMAYEKVNYMTYEEIQEFNSKFDKTYGYEPTSSWIRNLVSASILCRSSHGIAFTFPYARYFYMARYVKSNISSKELGNSVKKLFERYLSQIGDSQADTALMFIYSVCKDEYLISRFLEVATESTRGWSETRLDRDVQFIKHSVTSAKDTIDLPNLNPETSRQRMLQREDEIEDNVEQHEQDSEPSTGEEPRAEELVDKAFSSLGVLGQFLKSFSSELTHEKKKDLMQQAFSIALRIIWKALTTLSQNVESMLNDDAEVEGLRQKLGLQTPEEVITHSHKIASGMAWYLVFVLYKGAVSCLGSHTLRRQAIEVAKSMEIDSARLLLVAIGLEHYRSIPERQILELADEFSKNVFGYQLLRLLVYEHLLLYGEDRTRRSVRDRLKNKFRIRRLPPPMLGESP
jgi:predicted MPP superfamily phosphohydrolase